MSVEELYLRVTAAILRAEHLTDANAAASAFLEVSMLEDAIAQELPTQDPEGLIARRGAIEAALSARLPARALDLARRYAKEPGAPSDFVDAMMKLLADVKSL